MSQFVQVEPKKKIHLGQTAKTLVELRKTSCLGLKMHPVTTETFTFYISGKKALSVSIADTLINPT